MKTQIYTHVLKRGGNGVRVPDPILSHLAQAEVIRDKIMHGKNTLEREKREALYNVLTYAELLNEEVYTLGGFSSIWPA